MNIIYILTSLALIISYLLLNKGEKKENLIHSVIISVILFLTYNIFITQVMFFVHLESTLLNLAIVNIAFSAVFIASFRSLLQQTGRLLLLRPPESIYAGYGSWFPLPVRCRVHPMPGTAPPSSLPPEWPCPGS